MKNILTPLFLIVFLSLHAQEYDIYVSDAGNFNNPPWQILKYDSNGENPEVFIDNNLGWPQDIFFLEESNEVLISNLNHNSIGKYDAESGEFIEDFAFNISGPTRIKIGPDGLLYALQWSGNGKVKRYQLDGTYLGDFTSIGVTQSIGLDWDENGYLYVSSYGGATVRKFDTDGIDQGLFIDDNLLGPTNIWFDESGDLLVVDYNGASVKRFDSDGNYMGEFMTGLSNAEGVAHLPNGNILIGNGASHSVKQFDSNGDYIDDIVPESSGNLMTPNAVVLRNHNTLSTTQLSYAKHLITPTLGSQFRVDSAFASRISKIEVYNAAGYFVEAFENLRWNAQNMANGTYVINITFTDGQIHTEKIVVKR